MHFRPSLSLSKKQFLDACGASAGEIPPLYSEIPYVSPAMLYPFFSGKNSFLFESVKGPERIARYSFIGFDPYMVMRVKDGLLRVESTNDSATGRDKLLIILHEILNGYKQKPEVMLPPFQGGAAGLLSYDFVHYLEKLPRTTLDDLHIPDGHFFIIDRLIAFDHREKKAWAIVCPGVRNKTGGGAVMYDEGESVLGDISGKMEGCTVKQPPRSKSRRRTKIDITHDLQKEEYMHMVKRAKEYIAAGDIFQANLSQRVSAYIRDTNPWNLYEILREINPSPFGGFLDFGEYCIVSSSPERLVRVTDGIAETRPIAGTRPRGRDSSEDEAMRAELLLNEKERAEHIMLIDLERNDLGKVSDYGSVKVDELMITEDYSHVIHIVSNVRGTLISEKNCLDVIKAVFPGGTITGVPKVRCMEIIDELEPVRRGPYTGSMGYMGFSGSMDLNIIIRSFVIKEGYAYVQAGAGIVADSDPEREYHESLKKAEALIRTLERI